MGLTLGKGVLPFLQSSDKKYPTFIFKSLHSFKWSLAWSKIHHTGLSRFGNFCWRVCCLQILLWLGFEKDVKAEKDEHWGSYMDEKNKVSKLEKGLNQILGVKSQIHASLMEKNKILLPNPTIQGFEIWMWLWTFPTVRVFRFDPVWRWTPYFDLEPRSGVQIKVLVLAHL